MLIDVPVLTNAPSNTTAISAAIRPYSIAVTPDSSVQNARSSLSIKNRPFKREVVTET